jgi:hypothetical protein
VRSLRGSDIPTAAAPSTSQEDSKALEQCEKLKYTEKPRGGHKDGRERGKEAELERKLGGRKEQCGHYK